MIKLLAITTKPKRPSTRYRLLQYIPFLAKTGFIVTVRVANNITSRVKMINEMSGYDGLFIQKKLFSAPELALIRRKVKNIIYDFDDAVMFGTGSKGTQIRKKHMKRFRNIINKADFIIAGNGYLSDQIEEQYQSKTVTIPTVLDVSNYLIKGYNNEQNKVRKIVIGWLGTKTTLRYVKVLEPVFKELAREYSNLEIELVSDGQLMDKVPYVKNVQWSSDRETEILLDFDIGIMPLPDTIWTRGKCGFKLLQYMAAGLPVVSSPVGVNNSLVQHERNGFLAGSIAEWNNHLSTLIENNDLRINMGLAGRRYVEDNYNLIYWGPKTAELLRRVF